MRLVNWVVLGMLVSVGSTFAESEPMEGSKPDYVVYRPQQPRGGKNADPTKRGDCYNDHFQVIWDESRKLYYAFWTQGSGEGFGDMHVCFSKSADRGKTWTYPKVLAGGEKISEPKPRAVWQQPMLAKSGRLYCLWNQQVNDEKLHHGLIYGMYSDDAGETWSTPEENKSVPRQYRDDWKGESLPNWCNWQRPLRLAESDKFLVACTRHGTGRGEPHRSLAIEFWRFENIDENPEIKDIQITVLSGGKDAIRVPAGDTDRFICEEASIVKLPDGRLFALMRTRNRHPYWVQSRDGGVTWSQPEPLRDTDGVAYLHPCSPCPLYDVNGCEAASGEYVAFIHNAYDDSIPPLGRQPRGPVYMIRGRFDPTGAQPIAFGKPELFSPVKSGNSYYSSFTHAEGESVLWFAHQKHQLIGRKIHPLGKETEKCPSTDLNVRNFGAKGDGVTDDTDAFQRAADALRDASAPGLRVFGRRNRNERGGAVDGPHPRLVIPAGRYCLSREIIFMRDVLVCGEPGAEIVQTRAEADAFYCLGAYRTRIEGLTFRGGRTQIALPTRNCEGSNIRISGCRFFGSSAAAVESLSYGDYAGTPRVAASKDKYAMLEARRIPGAKYERVSEWNFDKNTKQYFRDSRIDEPQYLVVDYHSTLMVVEDCRFDGCRTSVKMHPDGGVIRRCQFRTATDSVGGAIYAWNNLHAYDNDFLLRGDGKRQSAIYCQGRTTFWIESSRVRTEDASGACVIEGAAIPHNQAAQVILNDLETDTGTGAGNAICRWTDGRFPNIVVLRKIRAAGSHPVEAMTFSPELTEGIARANRHFVDMDSDQSYSFVIGDCSENIKSPSGYAARFLRPLPEDACRGLNVCRESPKRTGPVFLAEADGVDTDPTTDDTAAMKRFLSRLAAHKGSIGILPAAWITVKDTLLLDGDFSLEGAGIAALDGGGGAEGYFKSGKDAQVTLKNLQVRGGRKMVDVVGGAKVVVDSCFAYDQEVATVTTAKDATLCWDGGVVYSSRLYEGEGKGFIGNIWLRYTPNVPPDSPLKPAPVIVNRGELEIWDLLGVPCVFDRFDKNFTMQPAKDVYEYRWVDNYGKYYSRSMRYGGEWGGIVPVFHYGDAETAMEGSYAWFWGLSVPHAPIVADSMTPRARAFGVVFPGYRKYLPRIEMLGRSASGAPLKPIPNARLESVFPLPGTFEGAKWIWPAELGAPTNTVVEFSRKFVAPTAGEAVLTLSADAVYHVALNGRLIHQGRLPDVPPLRFYDELPIRNVVAGTNELVISVYAQGVGTFQHITGDPGLIYVLKGKGLLVRSGQGDSWRKNTHYHAEGVPLITSQLGFSFAYDARSEEGSWSEINADDARKGENDYNWQRRPVPCVTIGDPLPTHIIGQGALDGSPVPDEAACGMDRTELRSVSRESFFEQDGVGVRQQYFQDGFFITVDLGREEAGFLDLEVETDAGAVIDIGHGEHIEGDKLSVVIGPRRFAGRYVAREGRQTFDHWVHRMAGRYVQIHVRGVRTRFRLHSLSVRPAEFPVEERPVPARLNANEQAIWRTGVRTLRLCMHEHYEDCPWREQALYANDARNQMLAGYHAFSPDNQMPELALTLLAKGIDERGWIELCMPAKIGLAIPSFTFSWVLALGDHLGYRHDLDFIRSMMPALKQVMDRRAEELVGDLLPCPRGKRYWQFYDWEKDLSGDLDKALAGQEAFDKDVFEAPLNLLSVLAFESAANCAESVGDTATARRWREVAGRMRVAVRSRFWNAAARQFETRLDGNLAPAELTQALALLAEVVPTDSRDAVVERLQVPSGWTKTSLSQSLYKYEALLKAGGKATATARRMIDETWTGMLKDGATSFWEVREGWRAFDGAGSLCHGWSAIPVYFYGAYPKVFSSGELSDAEKNSSAEMNSEPASASHDEADGFRILFIGNSITLHGPKPSIGWTNNWGMAASAAENDYVHLVTKALERREGRKASVRVKNLVGFERNFANWEVEKNVKDLVDFHPDYLIVALGENVKNLIASEDQAKFEDGFSRLLRQFVPEAGKGPKTVVRGVFWMNLTKDRIMSQVASELGVPFVRCDFSEEPGMTAAGLFAHQGVSRHPSDQGMAEIARRIVEAIISPHTTRK